MTEGQLKDGMHIIEINEAVRPYHSHWTVPADAPLIFELEGTFGQTETLHVLEPRVMQATEGRLLDDDAVHSAHFCFNRTLGKFKEEVRIVHQNEHAAWDTQLELDSST